MWRGGGIMNIIRDSIYLSQGISMHWVKVFPYDWVFPRVDINDTIMMWFMESQ